MRRGGNMKVRPFCACFLLLAVVVAVAGAGFASAPTGDSAGIAAAQTQNQSGPSVEIDSTNNTTTETVVVSEAYLPEGGFIAIHDEAYTQGVAHGSEITVSEYLSAGTHRNIQIPVNRSIPGTENTSRINATRGNISAVLYRDTNENQQFDFSKSFGTTDKPYEDGETGTVSDTELVSFESNVKTVRQRSEAKSASLQISDQQLRQSNGSTKLTVDEVTLSEGGFIAVHNQQYLPPTNNPLNSTIGLSRYLSSGTHRNVTIRVVKGSLNQTQTIIAIPYLDTDSDQTFDYTSSGGEVDYAYISQQSGSTTIVNATAKIRVPASMKDTGERASSPENQSGGVIEAGSGTETPARSANTTTTTSPEETGEGGIGGNWIYVVGAIIVVGIAVIVIWGFERRS